MTRPLPSRFDIQQLHARGADLARRARMGQQMTGLDQWTADVAALLETALPAHEASELQNVVTQLQFTTQDGLPSQQGVVSIIERTLSTLIQLAAVKLKETEVSDEIFVRFLTGAVFEDEQQTGLGSKLSTKQVARTENIDLADAQRALSRAVTRGLAQHDGLGDGFLLTDAERVKHEAQRLRQQTIPTTKPLTTSTGFLAPAELLSQYQELLNDLTELQASDPGGGLLPSDVSHNNLVPLEARARELMGKHAPELITQWDAVRKPVTETDDVIDVMTGSTAIGPLVAQMRQRLPLLRFLIGRINVTGPDIPDHFSQFARDLGRYWEDAPYDRSVFVMMKFPDRDRMSIENVALLESIYAAIDAELSRFGLVARRADDKSYRPELWDNLNVYMLGCKYGVALLEDRVEDAFNPNIALEYGFMRALGRDVALLREQNFKHTRADVIGTLAKSFTVLPDGFLDEDSVRDAIETWAIDLGLPAKKPRRKSSVREESRRASVDVAEPVVMNEKAPEASVQAVLSIDYSTEKMHTGPGGSVVRHDYELRVSLDNQSEKTLRTWHIDVEMPTSILRTDIHVAHKVNASSDKKKSVFRFTQDDRPQPIYPGEKVLFTIPYMIDDALFHHGEHLFAETVRARAFAEDKMISRSEKSVRDLQRF